MASCADDDETCSYGCLAIEYLYWTLQSLLGYQDGDNAPPGRCEQIADEWQLCNAELMEALDPVMTAVLRTPDLRHGEKAAELCKIDDREAVEKLSRRAFGTHATVGVDGSKTIEVYVPNVVRACMLALRARDRPWRLPHPPHAGPPVHA